MALAKATLTNVSVTPPVVTTVMFNPTDYGIDRGANYAELDVPGPRRRRSSSSSAAKPRR